MKKSTLIKLVKEELAKKPLLKEFDTKEVTRIGKLRGTLAGLIHYADNKSLEPQWLLNKISEIITKALEEDSKLGGNANSVNENEKGTLTKSELIDKLKQLDPNFEVTIPTVTMSGTFDSHAGLQTTAKEAIAKLQSTKKEGNFQQYNSGKDFIKFALVQSEDDQKRMEKAVAVGGSLD